MAEQSHTHNRLRNLHVHSIHSVQSGGMVTVLLRQCVCLSEWSVEFVVSDCNLLLNLSHLYTYAQGISEKRTV